MIFFIVIIVINELLIKHGLSDVNRYNIDQHPFTSFYLEADWLH